MGVNDTPMPHRHHRGKVQLFVPGRVCLFGEHSDWAGGYRRINPNLEKGYTLTYGTQQGLYAEVDRHPSALVLEATMDDERRYGPVEFPLEPDVLLAEAQGGGFWSYAAGTAYQVLQRYPVSGLVIRNNHTDLPIQKGLSSSAAVCVLVARAFSKIYGLNLSVHDEMEIAYLGETTTPSRCGRMDQVCAYGNQAVLMTYDGDDVSMTKVGTPRDLHFVLADLNAQKDTRKILSDLNRCFPKATTQTDELVQELLGAVNKDLVSRAVQALRAGDAEGLGRLMSEAQRLFDQNAVPACPDELTAPVLHEVLDYEPLREHVWGGKGVGSQGDGSAQFVARSMADQQAAVELLENGLGLTCLNQTLRASQEPEV